MKIPATAIEAASKAEYEKEIDLLIAMGEDASQLDRWDEIDRTDWDRQAKNGESLSQADVHEMKLAALTAFCEAMGFQEQRKIGDKSYVRDVTLWRPVEGEAARDDE